MKNLIEFLLIRLIDHPEDLQISEESSYNKTVYKIAVHPEDVGKVIGRGGKRIRALRKVAQILAIKRKTPVAIVIDED